jgi:pilus assembly protein CpaC
MTLIFFIFFRLLNATEQIIIAPGTSTEISVSAKQKIRAEKTPLIKIIDQGQTLRIIGKKIGQTQLQVGPTAYSVWVVRTPIFRTYQKLKKWSLHKRGPILQIENHQLQVSGQILTLEDWQELITTMDSQDDFRLRAQIDPSLKKQIEEKIKEWLEDNNLSFTSLSIKPEWTINLSQVNHEELKAYKHVVASLGLNVKVSANAVSSKPLIEVSIIAAEIQRSEIFQLGLRWPSATELQILPTLSATSTLAAIHHLEETGKGRILAKPTLLTQSGEDATFHSGGEFPIKAINQFQANVTWKKYGILLKIKPRADARGKMDLLVDCEFSSLDSREDESGVPGLLVHRVTSHITLEESKTVALSGLIKEEWRKNKVGLPWLQRIPVLSPLFSSESFKNNQSELIFFVTPRVVH